jgi:hypothetical protein
MSFFSNLKNFVTGNSAEISIVTPTVYFGNSATITVNVQVKDSAIKSKELYLNVECMYDSNNFNIERRDTNNDQKEDAIFVNSSKVNQKVFTKKYVLDTSSIYEKNQIYSFSQTITLDNDALLSINKGVKWRCLAGIDTSGNDPDSGWVEFEVKHDSFYDSGLINWDRDVPLFSLKTNQQYSSVKVKGKIAYRYLDNSFFRNPEHFGPFGMPEEQERSVTLNMVDLEIYQQLFKSINQIQISNTSISSYELYNSFTQKNKDISKERALKFTYFEIESIEFENKQLLN